jgi:hypothetical protein
MLNHGMQRNLLASIEQIRRSSQLMYESTQESFRRNG